MFNTNSETTLVYLVVLSFIHPPREAIHLFSSKNLLLCKPNFGPLTLLQSVNFSSFYWKYPFP